MALPASRGAITIGNPTAGARNQRGKEITMNPNLPVRRNGPGLERPAANLEEAFAVLGVEVPAERVGGLACWESALENYAHQRDLLPRLPPGSLLQGALELDSELPQELGYLLEVLDFLGSSEANSQWIEAESIRELYDLLCDGLQDAAPGAAKKRWIRERLKPAPPTSRGDALAGRFFWGLRSLYRKTLRSELEVARLLFAAEYAPEVKQARRNWRTLARQHHPDLQTDPKAAERFRVLINARDRIWTAWDQS